MRQPPTDSDAEKTGIGMASVLDRDDGEQPGASLTPSVGPIDVSEGHSEAGSRQETVGAGGDGPDGSSLNSIPGEYRIDELARAAGTTVRNVRAYQDRGLLPGPRRAGRIGLYSEWHLARLRLIGELLGRGFNLSNIADMIVSWEKGQDLSDLLGLETALIGPWSEEPAVPPNLRSMQAFFRSAVGHPLLDDAIRTGLIEAEGDDIEIKKPKALEVGWVLQQAGVPASELVKIAEVVERAVDQVAEAFVDLVAEHIFAAVGTPIPASEVPRLAALVHKLRPLAKIVVDEELAGAMERRIQTEVAHHLVLELGQDQAAS